ncbi:MAG: pantoate--beta-alanine ligase [Phycisphaerales bacterium]|nr:pantoate--beta-alanine ligase [Phycisphaerales bacterium]
MQIVRTISDLACLHESALVPTMGALHEGHRSLVRAAVASGRPAVVSIFVNPAQFAPGEDLDAYPRTLERDLDLCRDDGAAAVFAPEVDTVYPGDASVQTPPLPAVAASPGLEDACRPHFFQGVCRVVARLFDLVRPAEAFFGEKDWQQLRVVTEMVAAHQDRWPSLTITAHPTVREPDGLAMSSRNVYLSPSSRDRALALHRALSRASEGEPAMRRTLDAAGLTTDYAVIRDAETLLAPTADRPQRALVAASLDGTRLIDNAAVP